MGIYSICVVGIRGKKFTKAAYMNIAVQMQF